MCQQASAVPQTAEYPSNPSHATHPPQPHAHLIRRELPDASTIAGEWGRREAGQALPAVERGIQNGYADVESIDVAELRREQERRSTGQAVDRTGMDRWDPALLMNARAAAKRVEVEKMVFLRFYVKACLFHEDFFQARMSRFKVCVGGIAALCSQVVH